MSEVTIVWIDLAKRPSSSARRVTTGLLSFRKKLSRVRLLAFVAQQPICVIAMEACSTAHGSGREFEKPGHELRLVPPV